MRLDYLRDVAKCCYLSRLRAARNARRENWLGSAGIDAVGNGQVGHKRNLG